MFARMKGTVAKYEVEQKSARQKAANAERAKNGKPWIERRFGYDGNDHRAREAAVDPQGVSRAAQRRLAVEHRQGVERQGDHDG